MEHWRNTSLTPIVEEIDGIIYTEEWMPVFEYENLYSVSSFGRIKRTERRSVYKYCKKQIIESKIMMAKVTKKGYLRISLRRNKKIKWRYIHRLVAISFIEKEEGRPDVNHETGNKKKNHYSLLKWCTPQENNEHGVRIGLLKRGRNIKPYVSVRNEWSGRKPIIDLNTGIFLTAEDVADILGTSPGYVQKMLRGDRPLRATQYRYA